MKSLYILSITLFTLFSCSNLPSDSLQKKSLNQIISEISDNNVELIKFNKINAIEKKGEINTYLIEYEGEIKYLTEGFINDSYLNAMNIRYKEGFLNPRKNKKGIYKVFIQENSIRKIKGRLGFVLKENGWELMNIYTRIDLL